MNSKVVTDAMQGNKVKKRTYWQYLSPLYIVRYGIKPFIQEIAMLILMEIY